LALAAAGLLSTQAYASEAQIEAAIQPAQPDAAFTDADLSALFGQNARKPIQSAALSPQEMKETEGAAFNPWGAGAGAIWGGGAVVMNQIGQGRPIHRWNWGTIGTAASLSALHGGFAHMGPVARYVIPRVAFFGSFGAGRMGW
jgi:hypothetical protein